MNPYLDLYLTFARIGGFTFGGGYAMLPILQREVVEKRHWVTEDELMDYYAIGQCTPGIIAVNTATFVGYRTKGDLGGLVATLGVISPSLVIIGIISACLQNFAQYAVVQHALAGIRACVCALVLDAILKLGKKSLKDSWTWGLAAVVFAVSLFTKVPTTLLVICAGIAGVLIKTRTAGKAKPASGGKEGA